MAHINLPCGSLALIDDADVAATARINWRAERRITTTYVYGSVGGRKVYLHRLILKAPTGKVVDHANHNGLDNRRANLRLATQSQNISNSRQRSGIPSLAGLRGIYFDRGCWRAQIRNFDKVKKGPRRKDPIPAAFDYDRLAAAIFGEFATLNFPCAIRQTPPGDSPCKV